MAKSIDAIKVSFTGKDGNLVKGLTVIPQGRFPAYQWWTQECHRFLALYEAYGFHVRTLLEGFADGQRFQETAFFGYDEYNGNPLAVIRVADDDRRPVKIGLTKAKAVVAHIITYGLDNFIAACREVAAQSEIKTEQSPKFGKKKGGGSRGQSLEQIEENTHTPSPAPQTAKRSGKAGKANVAPNSPAARKLDMEPATVQVETQATVVDMSGLYTEKLRLYRRLLEIREIERAQSLSLVTA